MKIHFKMLSAKCELFGLMVLGPEDMTIIDK